MTRYRDAILYVHDETVKGMNAGKDVLTLMNEIKLPPNLDIGETYGRISWSVRGIYEGYVGWFDGNVSTMFGPASQGYGEIVKLAGGPNAVASRASDLATSDPVRALYPDGYGPRGRSEAPGYARSPIESAAGTGREIKQQQRAGMAGCGNP